MRRLEVSGAVRPLSSR